MARAILSSAKHGAYLAIGLYVTMVLVITLSTQYQDRTELSPHIAQAFVTHGHGASSPAVDADARSGATGA